MSKKLLIGIVLVLLLGIVFSTGFYMAKGNNKTDDSPTKGVNLVEEDELKKEFGGAVGLEWELGNFDINYETYDIVINELNDKVGTVVNIHSLVKEDTEISIVTSTGNKKDYYWDEFTKIVPIKKDFLYRAYKGEAVFYVFGQLEQTTEKQKIYYPQINDTEFSIIRIYLEEKDGYNKYYDFEEIDEVVLSLYSQ